MGKTTLLYKLKMGNTWKSSDIIKDIGSIKPSENRGFHFETFRNLNFKYGIWDLPGRISSRLLWPTFYRFLQTDSVLFMLRKSMLEDQSKEALAEMQDLRRRLKFLLQEDELRDAPFCIIVNQTADDANTGLTTSEVAEILLIDDGNFVSEERVRVFFINAAEASDSGPDWPRVIEFIRKYLAK